MNGNPSATGRESDPRDRDVSIRHLRGWLTSEAGNESSVCRIASERGIFCGGFRRWSPAEFDRRCRRAIGRSTHLSREQMERYADIWQLIEQLRQGVALACDAAPGASSPCRGWAEFSDEELARFCRASARDEGGSAGSA
jgi:hypothetical protein